MTFEVLENTDPEIIRIFIVRHGQTDHNVQKILQGHLDTDLNETGRNQAQTVGKFFSQIPIDYFLSSDLIRCQQTLQPIMAHQEKDNVKYTANLRERDMGKVQGMYLKDALETYGPGFRNLGEKEAELCARVGKEWLDLVDQDYSNVIFCTHGDVITRFTKYLHETLGYKLNNKLTPADLKVPFNTSITVVDVNKKSKEGIIQDFGNTLHLGGQFEVKEQMLR
ncbi:MAG: histidine phosphatase family protein [Asgard group archaeon]|nr:histidine phosphatase family protein [Asgard group archaeon]